MAGHAESSLRLDARLEFSLVTFFASRQRKCQHFFISKTGKRIFEAGNVPTLLPKKRVTDIHLKNHNLNINKLLIGGVKQIQIETGFYRHCGSRAGGC